MFHPAGKRGHISLFALIGGGVVALRLDHESGNKRFHSLSETAIFPGMGFYASTTCSRPDRVRENNGGSFGEKRDVTLLREVFTIGFPQPNIQGFDPKFGKGVISGRRGLEDREWMYQHDVPSQPGNSGGPLVDSEKGTVVGVIFLRLSDPASQNVNYAIKTRYVREFLAKHRREVGGLPIPRPRRTSSHGPHSRTI